MCGCSKVGKILFGMFSYKRVPAAQIDGGMGEYAFQQFQPLPAVDPINGRGYHVRGQLFLTSPGLVALNPAGTPFDVTKLILGDPDMFISGGEGSYQS